MAESKLKADQIVAGGIRLLQLLTAAPNQSVPIRPRSNRRNRLEPLGPLHWREGHYRYG